MCLLIAKPAGVALPDVDETCLLAHETNSDGFGAAWKEADGQIWIVKGLMDVTAQAEWCEKIGQKEALFHWRFGTSGGVHKHNCHPFALNDGSVFAHNGIMPIKTRKGISDTRFMAENSRSADVLMKNVSDYVGKSNKFAILRPEADMVILGENEGTWQDGVWYSNMYWAWNGYTHSSTTASVSQYRDPFERYRMDDELEDYDAMKDLLRQMVEKYGRRTVLDTVDEVEDEMWMA